MPRASERAHGRERVDRGVAILLLLIYRASRPYVATLGKTVGPDGQYGDIDRHRDARPPEHIAVLRVESGLYFANADAVRTRILQAAAPGHIRAVVLDAETTPFIDVTSARMLADLTDELHERAIQLLIAREIGEVRDVLRPSSTTACSPTSTRRSKQPWTPPQNAERETNSPGALGRVHRLLSPPVRAT